VEQLQRADLVVGFNVIDFDYQVLRAYSPFDLEYTVPTLDMLAEVEKSAGRRIGLDDIASATLGVNKIAEGLEAIKWWREGKLFEIAEYCCFDVKVTRLIHEHGAAHGELFYDDRFKQRQRIAVSWPAPK
jgi:DEAD/DEAH box helicase domain-containing protein